MKQINQEDLEEAIVSGVSIVDFYADWCGPCKMLSTTLNQVEQSSPNVSFYKVDIDNNMELTANLGIKNIPTVIFFKNGIEQKRLLGNNPPQSYENIINELFNSPS
jgi:thioredoxin 1